MELRRIISFSIFFKANQGFLSSLIVPLCDWELVQVVLRVTNEELAGKNTEKQKSVWGEREEMKSDT